MVETKDNEILKMLELQAEQVKQKSELKQIIENQNKIIKLLEQNNSNFFYYKRKKYIKNILYFIILIFIFYYFNIYNFVINFYDYYYYFLDMFNKINDFSQTVVNIPNDIHKILEYQQNLLDRMDINQQQLLQQTFQKTMKVGDPKNILTTQTVLKPFWLFK